MIKRVIKNRLDDYYKRKMYIPDPFVSLVLLKNLGFNPSVVFDVGVYNGDFTKLIQSIWHNANVTCFEALPDKVALLKSAFKDSDNITVIEGLLGERDDDNVKFHEVESASSVLQEHESNNFKVGFHKMRKLDTYLFENNAAPPQLLKLDTQGYEYNILKGFENNLNKCEVILAELNFIDIHKEVKLGRDVINLVHDHGFAIFDVCQLHRRPSDKVLWQADFIFVKEDSTFRRNKKW